MARRAAKKSETIGATAAPDLEGGVLDPYEGGDFERGFVIADVTVPGFLDLAGTHAEFGHFERLRFDGTSLAGSQLRGVTLIDAELRGCDTSNAAWPQARLSRVVFTDCRMTGVSMNDAHLTDVVFRGCKIDFANLRMSTLSHVTFEDCLFDETEFNGAKIELTRFAGCRMARCDLTSAAMRAADMRGSEIVLRGAATDLGGAIVTPLQLMELAPALARDAGIGVAEEGAELDDA